MNNTRRDLIQQACLQAQRALGSIAGWTDATTAVQLKVASHILDEVMTYAGLSADSQWPVSHEAKHRLVQFLEEGRL